MRCATCEDLDEGITPLIIGKSVKCLDFVDEWMRKISECADSTKGGKCGATKCQTAEELEWSVQQNCGTANSENGALNISDQKRDAAAIPVVGCSFTETYTP